jgi:hypothetical protein
MGIRETLNKKPGVAIAVASALVVVAVAVMIWANRGVPHRVSTVYYTDDNGKSWFADDVDKLYPFDRSGKQAYRAYVYQCGSEPPFVHYMAKLTDAGRTKISELQGKPNDPEAKGLIAKLRSTAIEVKRPADEKWVPLFSAAGDQIARHPTCPDGSRARDLYP